MNAIKLGVLASHEGTTLQALIDACEAGSLTANLAVVISNNRRAGSLRRAQHHGIPHRRLSGQTHPDSKTLDRVICQTLEQYNVDLVVLAGYMKKLGPHTLERFQGRILNTHPALLPKFGRQGMYGLRVHEAVLAAGESVTGVSVHIVDAEYDTGPVVAQCEVPVLPGDTVDTLAHRVQERERAFLVEVLQSIADGNLVLPLI